MLPDAEHPRNEGLILLRKMIERSKIRFYEHLVNWSQRFEMIIQMKRFETMYTCTFSCH